MARAIASRYDRLMSALPKSPMSAEDYLAWVAERPGRYELVDGVVVAHAAERAAHAAMKGEIYVAFRDAIAKRGAPCHALPDGMAVRIGKTTIYEPDALVYCGPKIPPDALFLETPTIVVEVLSPSTGRNDHARKLLGYFSVPSVMHYLVVDPDEPIVVHYRRQADGALRTTILNEGVVTLDPPGLAVDIGALYPARA
jgi:Uma2 family endonuclease